MSIEAMKRAIDALNEAVAFREGGRKKAIDAITALRTAIQQAESEPVYWEWRHQGSHPDAVDFGQWSEWKRVEPRSLLHTVDDALREFKGYIARGSKYELRALYTHPAPGVPDVDFDLQELREIERAMDDFADCGETDVSDALLLRGVRAGFLECTHFHVANRGALQDAIDAAMLTAAPAQKGGE